MTYLPLKEVDFGETWSVLEFALDDRPMIMRLRAGLESISGHPELPHRLRIVWEYESPNESGFPHSYDLELINQCDNELFDALEADNHAVLVYVTTCDNLRQWVFYTSDLRESAQRINSALPQENPYPIKMEADPDPDWSEYRDINANFGSSQ